MEKKLKEIARKRKEVPASAEDTELAAEKVALQKKIKQEEAQYRLQLASISSFSELRACVKRDLDWLMNAHNYAPQEDLEDYPYVAKSVLNYGLPDLAGQTASGIDSRTMESMMKQAILDFEPRILPDKIKVRLLVDNSAMNYNALTFDIEGELWSEPLPIHLHLRTELELENGSMKIAEFKT